MKNFGSKRRLFDVHFDADYFVVATEQTMEVSRGIEYQVAMVYPDTVDRHLPSIGIERTVDVFV